MRFAPESREDLEKPDLTGSWEQDGAAYLFHFPFDVFVDPDLEELQESYVDDTWITLYPPFNNRDTESRDIEQIQVEKIPTPDGTVAPDYDRVRLQYLQLQRELGYPTDSMRIDLSPDRDAAFAKRIINQFLGLARWWTFQWWIGKTRRYSDQYLRNWFRINEENERISGIQGFATAYGFLGFEQELDVEKFRYIRGNITNGREIPLHWDLFNEAIYYHADQDVRKTVIELAIACEAGVASIFEKLGESQSDITPSDVESLQDSNFEDRIAGEAEDLVGSSFAQTNPSDYENIYDLWVARGHVAHGKPPIIRGGDVWASEDLVEVIESTLHLLQWLERFNPERNDE